MSEKLGQDRSAVLAAYKDLESGVKGAWTFAARVPKSVKAAAETLARYLGPSASAGDVMRLALQDFFAKWARTLGEAPFWLAASEQAKRLFAELPPDELRLDEGISFRLDEDGTLTVRRERDQAHYMLRADGQVLRALPLADGMDLTFYSGGQAIEHRIEEKGQTQ